MFQKHASPEIEPGMPGRREFLAKSLAGFLVLNPALGASLPMMMNPCPAARAACLPKGFVMESAPGPETVINGRRCLYFGGTGYFALHGHRKSSPPGIAAFRKYGCHSATSRTGFGNTPVQLELERKIADYFETEDSLHFVSGYLDNLFLVQALKARVGAIFIDETAHFSIRDAVYSALKPVYTFQAPGRGGSRSQAQAEPQGGRRPPGDERRRFPTFGLIAPGPRLSQGPRALSGLPLPRRLPRRRRPRPERPWHVRALRRQIRPLLLCRDHEQGLRRARGLHHGEQGVHRPPQGDVRRLPRCDAEPDAGHGRLDQRPGDR